MRGLGTDDHPPFLNRDLATGPAVLTRDDVEVCRLAVQLALRAALHGCHRELVPPPWQQIPNRVGHQLPVGDVAALGALACGHIDDIRLQRCAWSWCVPEYVGRGGCDSGGGQVCWRQGTWTRHGQQEVKGRVDTMWDLRGVAEAASEARSVTWTKASELRPGLGPSGQCSVGNCLEELPGVFGAEAVLDHVPSRGPGQPGEGPPDGLSEETSGSLGLGSQCCGHSGEG